MEKLKQLPNSWWCRVEQQSICGTPDTLGCIRGQMVAIEFKSSATAKVTKLQEHTLNKISESQGLAIVAYPENWEHVFTALINLASTGQMVASDGTNFQ
jgi:hypothetical protein